MPRQISKQNSKEKKLQAILFNIDGESVGKISLPPEIFAYKVGPKLLAQAVYIHLANQRAGTRSTKTRSQVTGSTRKIYRQKGTGRARHGDITAPIFVGGGIVGGPKPRDYSANMNKKQKRKALFISLSEKAKRGEVRV